VSDEENDEEADSAATSPLPMPRLTGWSGAIAHTALAIGDKARAKVACFNKCIDKWIPISISEKTTRFMGDCHYLKPVAPC
jgi:hypothetical protein